MGNYFSDDDSVDNGKPTGRCIVKGVIELPYTTQSNNGELDYGLPKKYVVEYTFYCERDRIYKN